VSSSEFGGGDGDQQLHCGLSGWYDAALFARWERQFQSGLSHALTSRGCFLDGTPRFNTMTTNAVKAFLFHTPGVQARLVPASFCGSATSRTSGPCGRSSTVPSALTSSCAYACGFQVGLLCASAEARDAVLNQLDVGARQRVEAVIAALHFKSW
jgi:hypothetical protein